VTDGVETEEQAGRLLELGCDEAQGFLFSRPLPAAEVAKLLPQIAAQSSVLSIDQAQARG